jgi:hypothetical protein
MNSTDQVHAQEGINKPLPSEPEHDLTTRNMPETAVLMSMDAFASIEFGVAKLEIAYQDNLRCIAMTSEGWRCQGIIHHAQLHKARDLLSSLVVSGTEVDMVLLPPLVLCPGHAQGDLPRIYAESWTSFAEQRLPKEEAMRKFNADFWLSVQFFPTQKHGEPVLSSSKESQFSPEGRALEAKRSRSASNLSARLREHNDSVKDQSTGRDSLFPPLEAPLGYRGQEFDFSEPKMRFTVAEWEAVFGNPAFGEEQSTVKINNDTLREARSADGLRTSSGNFDSSNFTSPSVPVPQPALDESRMAVKLDDGAATASDLKPPDTSVTMPDAFTSLKIADEVPQPTQDTSSASNAAIENIKVADQPGTENAKTGLNTSPDLSQEAANKWTRADCQSMVDGNYSNLMKKFTSPISRAGWVYIFKSHEGKLVKVSRETDIQCRSLQIHFGCKLPVCDECEVESRCIWNPERVLELVHLELQDFQAKTTCIHYQESRNVTTLEMEHRQWFDVPKAVVIASLELWSGFVKMAYHADGTITEYWKRKTSMLPKPSDVETAALEAGLKAGGGSHLSEYHSLRNKRYAEWIEKGKLPDLL